MFLPISTCVLDTPITVLAELLDWHFKCPILAALKSHQQHQCLQQPQVCLKQTCAWPILRFFFFFLWRDCMLPTLNLPCQFTFRLYFKVWGSFDVPHVFHSEDFSAWAAIYKDQVLSHGAVAGCLSTCTYWLAQKAYLGISDDLLLMVHSVKSFVYHEQSTDPP